MDIDLLSPASFDGGQPHDQYAWLRANAPCYFHPEPDGPGFWAVTRQADIRAIGRDPETFSSEPTIMIPDPEPGSGMDFGDHRCSRSPANARAARRSAVDRKARSRGKSGPLSSGRNAASGGATARPPGRSSTPRVCVASLAKGPPCAAERALPRDGDERLLARSRATESTGC